GIMTDNKTADYAWSVPGGLVERPGMVPDAPEIWAYCSSWSYELGERVDVHVHTTEPSYDLTITRDGLVPEIVYQAIDLPGTVQSSTNNAYEAGCGWSISHSIHLDERWLAGFYLVSVSINAQGKRYSQDAFFLLKACDDCKFDFALIHATSTLLS